MNDQATELYCLDCQRAANTECKEKHRTSIQALPGERYGFVVFTGRYKILDYHKADGQQIATADGEEEARTIVRALNASNAYAALVAQRERLVDLLRQDVSPRRCYCEVMDGAKCWPCRARELIATIESEDQR